MNTESRSKVSKSFQEVEKPQGRRAGLALQLFTRHCLFRFEVAQQTVKRLFERIVGFPIAEVAEYEL
jgi:hypothetical protein